MLALKPQIDTTPAFMGSVLSLPFDQKLPLPGTIDRHTCESSPSRLRIFVSSPFVPASNRGILFLCRAAILLVIVCLHSSVGIALDPSRKISQYQHTAWRSQDGFIRGSQMTQTADGYLWLGTTEGLFRFDGVQFVPFAPKGINIPTRPFTSLLGSRDGSLWIGTATGLSRLKDGKLQIY